MFFFEKKNQETFTLRPWPPHPPGHGRRIKVFCFFSSEKKVLLAFLCTFGIAHAETGAAIFNERCALCHQPDAHGAPGVAPSLAGTLARYTKTPDGIRYLSQIVVSGMVGKIPTEGHSFSGLMPSFADDLSDAQVAAVVDYVLTTYNGVSQPPVTQQEVAQARATHPVPTQTRHLREKILAAAP